MSLQEIQQTVYQPVQIRQRHGGALTPGNPGNKGGGRTSHEFQQKIRDACEDPEELGALLISIVNSPCRLSEKIYALDTYLKYCGAANQKAPAVMVEGFEIVLGLIPWISTRPMPGSYEDLAGLIQEYLSQVLEEGRLPKVDPS